MSLSPPLKLSADLFLLLPVECEFGSSQASRPARSSGSAVCTVKHAGCAKDAILLYPDWRRTLAGLISGPSAFID